MFSLILFLHIFFPDIIFLLLLDFAQYFFMIKLLMLIAFLLYIFGSWNYFFKLKI